MAGSLNKTLLIGRMGKDPVGRQAGAATVAAFSLATDESYKNKDGQKIEKTAWHRIEVWGRQADFVLNYLSKGRLVYVEGKIEYGEYQKDGVTIPTTVIKADRVVGLDSNQGAASPAPQQEYAGRQDMDDMDGAPF